MTLRKRLSAFLLIVYFAVMFPFLHRMESALGEYASYFFETAFVIGVVLLFKERLKLGLKISWRLSIEIGAFLAAGFAIYRLAAPLSLEIPFDLRSRETLLFLLLIGPVLEESVFRLAHWELLSEYLATPLALVLATSVIFSFAHFFAWWSVPPELHGFVVYQAIYTLGLGIYLGLRRWETRGISVPILLHVAFNLGFLLGFVA